MTEYKPVHGVVGYSDKALVVRIQAYEEDLHNSVFSITQYLMRPDRSLTYEDMLIAIDGFKALEDYIIAKRVLRLKCLDDSIYFPADMINEIVKLYSEGLSQRAVAERLGVSLYVVRRVLGKYGFRGAYTCPRCLHRLRVVDRSLVQVDGRYAIKQVLHCPNCGYDEVRID